MTEISLKLDGLNCGNCVRSVKEALNSLDNVSNTIVGIKEAKVIIVREDENSVQELISAIEFAGYGAKIV
jgi:copper chaperone CopZ